MSLHPITDQLPATHVREIGRIVVKWAYLEWRLLQIVQVILGIGPKEGRLSITKPRAPDYLDMICDLMKVRDIKVTGVNFKALRKVLDESHRARNALAHSVWLEIPGADPTFQRVYGQWKPESHKPKVKRVIDPQGMSVSVDALRFVTQMIDTSQETLRILEGKIRNALASSPQTHP